MALINDWNPMNSFLGTGEGTVWGPRKYGPGVTPQGPKTFNMLDFYSPQDALIKSRQRANNQQGMAQLGAWGHKAAGMGAGQSAGAQAGVNDTLAGIQGTNADIATAADNEAMQRAIQQQQFATTNDMDRWKTELAVKQAADKQAAEEEQNRLNQIAKYVPFSKLFGGLS